MRSVYTRSSVSTHTPTDQNEVLRIHTYVRAANLAETPRDAFFRLISSLILRFHHVEVAPIERLLLMNGGSPVAYTSKGKLLVAAGVDYLLWSRPVHDFVRALAAAEVPGARVDAREIWLSGEASPIARREIEALGVRVIERVLERMVPRLSEDPAWWLQSRSLPLDGPPAP